MDQRPTETSLRGFKFHARSNDHAEGVMPHDVEGRHFSGARAEDRRMPQTRLDRVVTSAGNLPVLSKVATQSGRRSGRLIFHSWFISARSSTDFPRAESDDGSVTLPDSARGSPGALAGSPSRMSSAPFRRTNRSSRCHEPRRQTSGRSERCSTKCSRGHPCW